MNAEQVQALRQALATGAVDELVSDFELTAFREFIAGKDAFEARGDLCAIKRVRARIRTYVGDDAADQ